MTSSLRLEAARPLVLALPLLLAGPCGSASGSSPLVCTLSADELPAPAVHGRRRITIAVREGAAPLESAQVSLRVESGPGVLTEESLTTGTGGLASSAVASGRGGTVVVSAALEGGARPISCGRLALRFSEAEFPVVQTGLVRWLR